SPPNTRSRWLGSRVCRRSLRRTWRGIGSSRTTRPRWRRSGFTRTPAPIWSRRSPTQGESRERRRLVRLAVLRRVHRRLHGGHAVGAAPRGEAGKAAAVKTWVVRGIFGLVAFT